MPPKTRARLPKPAKKSSKVMPFHLLRLPLIACENVLASMYPKQVLAISTISKRALATVRACQTSCPYELTISSVSHLQIRVPDAMQLSYLSIDIEEPSEESKKNAKDWRFGDVKVPFIDSKEDWDDNIVCYGEPEKIMPKILEHFTKAFNISSIVMGVEEGWVEEVPKLQKNLKTVKIDANAVTLYSHFSRQQDDKLAREAFEMFRDVPNIYSHCETSFEFEFDSTSIEPFTFESIHIRESRWITAKNFLDMFMKCKQVVLDSTQIKAEEISAILKKWIEGNSKIEYLQMNHSAAKFPDIFAKLKNVKMVKKAEIGGDVQVFKEGNAFIIEQKSETKAIVYNTYGLMRLDTNFELI